MIVSTVNGRMRIRFNRLRSPQIANKAKLEIEAINGIYSCRANPGATSLIIQFNPAEFKIEKLEEHVMQICVQSAKKTTIKKGSGENSNKKLAKKLNQVTKVGMIGTLTASVAYGFLGKKRPHIYYGVGFLAFAGLHMLRYSRTLFK